MLVRSDHTGISLVVWWLRLRTSDARGVDELPCLCSPIILHIPPPWCSRFPHGRLPHYTARLLGAGLQPCPHHTPTASSGLVSVGDPHRCLKEGKKKAYMSKVVEEGFMGKVGFEHYLAGTRFYKRRRRGESVGEVAKPGEKERVGWGKHRGCPRDRSHLCLADSRGPGRNREARLRPGWEATGVRTCFSNRAPWNTSVPLSWKCDLLSGFPLSSRHFFVDQFENNCRDQ